MTTEMKSGDLNNTIHNPLPEDFDKTSHVAILARIKESALCHEDLFEIIKGNFTIEQVTEIVRANMKAELKSYQERGEHLGAPSTTRFSPQPLPTDFDAQKHIRIIEEMKAHGCEPQATTEEEFIKLLINSGKRTKKE